MERSGNERGRRECLVRAEPIVWEHHTDHRPHLLDSRSALAGMPLRDRDAEYVLSLLSGVEQIPRHVLEDDVPWDRDSFGEYTTSMVRHGIAERVLSVPGGPCHSDRALLYAV